MKKPHGGARPGSGRKKTENKPEKEAITMKVDPELSRMFKQLCAARKRSQPAQFEALLTREDRLAEGQSKAMLLLSEADNLIGSLINPHTSGLLRNRAERFFNMHKDLTK